MEYFSQEVWPQKEKEDKNNILEFNSADSSKQNFEAMMLSKEVHFPLVSLQSLTTESVHS